MKVESINIRRAKQEDSISLVQFNILMARETENKELIPEVISSGVKSLIENSQLGFYIVAEYNGKIIASLMITTEWSDWRNGNFWWIQSVYVIPDWRKKSVYRRLYSYVKELARGDVSFCGFRLYVERKNIITQKTYIKVGMNETNYKMFEELKLELK